MPKAKKSNTKRKQKVPISKTDTIGYKGGLDVNLSKRIDGKILKEELGCYVSDVLEMELKNQKQRVDNIAKWNAQYKGIRPEKEYPTPGRANVAHPVTRSNTDALYVRIVDALYNKKNFVTVKATDTEFEEFAPQMEDWLNMWLKNEIKIKETLDSPLRQAVKTGKGLVKIQQAEEKCTITRYATPDEVKDSNIKTFKLQGTDEYGVKEVTAVYNGPKTYPVDRKDWFQTSTSTSIDTAHACGFRIYKRKPEILGCEKKGLYLKGTMQEISNPDKYDEVTRSRLEKQYKLSDVVEQDRPHEIWEIWIKYDVDGDGEEDDIVVTFHRESKTICRAIYNPHFTGFRPFADFIACREEYSNEGEGTVEILEKLQIHIDTINNQRLDRMTQINGPIMLKRANVNLKNFEMIPGAVFEVDGLPSEAIEVINFPDVYYSTFQEEDRLLQAADRAVGITNAVMGQSTAERPVAKETFALIQEANKKFKELIDNIRDCITEYIWKNVEFFAQYQPTFTYKSDNKDGAYDIKTINFPVQYLRKGLKIELAASSELFNEEIRREIAIMKYQMVSDYQTKVAGMVNALSQPMTPPAVKQYIARALEIDNKLMQDVMRDFDTLNSEDIIFPVADIIKAAITMPAPMPPPPPPGQQPKPQGQGQPQPPQQPGMMG